MLLFIQMCSLELTPFLLGPSRPILRGAEAVIKFEAVNKLRNEVLFVLLVGDVYTSCGALEHRRVILKEFVQMFHELE